ncbi:Pbn1p TDEL_0C06890 [Torulaspora delbrueckii]|uniref:Protein PBN1 n=1 Tax=Torulaspora delbrueckii TaxID=4950 RepID=G8ZQU1_TORDE|nr:hypothetical protein TDEL_0C06890 [Torulaspora delbrueckii]CCE91578.1 hypothetical protein TDEL_0C06890 [Torulaspora delbrueckii]
MTAKSRFTVLFEEAEDVGNHLRTDDYSLTVDGGPTAITQHRWTWGNASDDNDDITRITWRAGKLRTSNLSEVISSVLSPGFNVYKSLGEPLEKSVDTPLFKSFHSESFDIDSFLPVDSEARSLPWNAEDCDLDIRLRSNYTEVAQWCPLHENETVTFKRETGIDSSQAGLFYLDSRDDTLVNLSGLTCKWNASGNIEKCQKTTLFYKTPHMPTVSLETAVVELETPVGLHPKLMVNLTSAKATDKCEYYMLLQLPVDVFVDKYQSTPLFVFGEHDLELPEYKLRDKSWGSESLFRMEPGMLNELTLHSRYVEPVVGEEAKIISFTPVVFQACDSDQEDLLRNPFYSKGMGYESYFTPNTVFTHFNSQTLEVPIPKPDLLYYDATKFATLACLLVSMIYILSKVVGKPRSRRHSAR